MAAEETTASGNNLINIGISTRLFLMPLSYVRVFFCDCKHTIRCVNPYFENYFIIFRKCLKDLSERSLIKSKRINKQKRKGGTVERAKKNG